MPTTEPVLDQSWNIQRWTFALDEATPLRLATAYEPVAPAPTYDVHFELEVGIVISGRMRRSWRDWQVDLGPGDAWLCGPWEPHGWQVIDGPSTQAVWVVRPQALAGLRFPESPATDWLAPFAATPARRPRADAGRRRELLDLAGRLPGIDLLPDGERMLRARLLLIEALAVLTRGWRAPTAWGRTRDDDYDLLQRAVALLFERRGAITAQAAARACGVCRNTFDRRFATGMGMSFARFAERYRLGGAADDLVRGDQSLKAVAQRWGFVDSSHFARRFAAHYGCAPAAYRRARRDGGTTRPT